MSHKSKTCRRSRFDAAQSEEGRNAFANLILMCRHRHKVIDSEPDLYTVDALTELKSIHENVAGRPETQQDGFFAKVPLNHFRRISVTNNSGNVAINSPGAMQAQTIIVKTTAKKISVSAPPGTIGADQDVSRYVRYLIKQYNEFAGSDSTRKTSFSYGAIPADPKLFRKLAAMGVRLTALHLLTSPELDPPACRFEGEGDSRISKGRKAGFRYEPGEQRVYINATQYFAPVPEGVWLYRVGGHQVCEKWLKERQERHLELDDIRTYCRIVTALGRTLVIQTEIDVLYPGIEKNVVAIPGNTSKVDSGSPTIGSTRRQTNRA